MDAFCACRRWRISRLSRFGVNQQSVNQQPVGTRDRVDPGRLGALFTAQHDPSRPPKRSAACHALLTRNRYFFDHFSIVFVGNQDVVGALLNGHDIDDFMMNSLLLEIIFAKNQLAGASI